MFLVGVGLMAPGGVHARPGAKPRWRSHPLPPLYTLVLWHKSKRASSKVILIEYTQCTAWLKENFDAEHHQWDTRFWKKKKKSKKAYFDFCYIIVH